MVSKYPAFYADFRPERKFQKRGKEKKIIPKDYFLQKSQVPRETLFWI
jgi:hypothetical protein